MVREKLKRRRKRRRIFFAVLLLAVMIAAAAIYLYNNTYLTDISVTGNYYVTEDVVTGMLFESEADRRYYHLKWQEMFGEQKELPMIQSYRLNFDGRHRVTVEVVENEVIGGIHYMDSYLYFDRQGYILTGSRFPVSGVPLINGISFSGLAMLQQAQSSRAGLFEEIEVVTEALKRYHLEAKSLIYDSEQSLTVDLGDIRVSLGAVRDLDEQFSELVSIMSGLEGRKGTLHMESYDMNNRSGTYYFQLD